MSILRISLLVLLLGCTEYKCLESVPVRVEDLDMFWAGDIPLLIPNGNYHTEYRCVAWEEVCHMNCDVG